MRLDVYMATYYPEHSRSVWQKYIDRGCVSVNGVVETSTKKTLGEDDEVSFILPEKMDFSADTLPILYEDDNVLVINKPAGVLTHSKGALNDEFTVAEFARPFTTFKADTNRPGIIHRLDRDTSGVIAIAKNDETAAYLQKQFSQRTVKKTYVAIVKGEPKQESAIIDVPIGRNPKAPSTFRVDPSGKSAATRYDVLDSHDGTSFVRLQPTTGRTHQLRVHLAYINTPIIGDKVYGKIGDRMFLHAYKLELTLPGGTRTVFEAPIPKVFTNKYPDIQV